MAWSLNKAFIVGNVTRDPETRVTPNGQTVANFGVATNRRWKDGNGAVQEDTQFHDVVVWGKLAETISQIIKKGNKVVVIGRIQTRSWEAQDGSKRNKTEIVMEDFVPLTSKGAGSGFDSEPDSSDSPAAPAPKKSASKEAPADDEINLDDIPF